MRTTIRILYLTVVAAVTASAPAGAQLKEWAAHGGSFNATKNPSAAEIGFETRFATPWPAADLTVGVAGTEDASFWLWAGARYNFQLDRRWGFALGLALGVYEEGGGKDLGGPIEFRSSYELSYKTSERSRLGLVFYHLSNAGIYDLNPGSNSIVLAWSTRRQVGDTIRNLPSRPAASWAGDYVLCPLLPYSQTFQGGVPWRQTSFRCR